MEIIRQIGLRNVIVKLVMCNMILENRMNLDIVQYAIVNVFHCEDVADCKKRPGKILSSLLQFNFSKTLSIWLKHFWQWQWHSWRGLSKKALINRCWSFDILRPFEESYLKIFFHQSLLQAAAKGVLLKSVTMYCGEQMHSNAVRRQPKGLQVYTVGP